MVTSTDKHFSIFRFGVYHYDVEEDERFNGLKEFNNLVNM